MTKRLPTIWLDMDGTIADFYAIPNWLAMLRTENTKPYEEAKPLLSTSKVNYLQNYIRSGGSVGIISWTSKCGSPAFMKEIVEAKVKWLKQYLPLPYAEVHIVEYGTPKSLYGKTGDILLDDEYPNIEDYCSNGKRFAFHPSEWDRMVEHLQSFHNYENRG